tara:strand:- start:121 stop:621 length:501 start_codon:yes stop_codon:yes gene_type:complete
MEVRLETKQMKLTKETLKRIIKEELEAVINEEELDEGMRDLFLGSALAMGGLAGANKAYDAYNQDRIEQVEDYGPQDTRNKIEKSRSAIQQHEQAAEDAAARGDFKEAERQLFKLHKQLESVELDAAFATGGFDAAGEVDYDLLGNVQKDLAELQADYARMQRIKE